MCLLPLRLSNTHEESRHGAERLTTWLGTLITSHAANSDSPFTVSLLAPVTCTTVIALLYSTLVLILQDTYMLCLHACFAC